MTRTKHPADRAERLKLKYEKDPKGKPATHARRRLKEITKDQETRDELHRASHGDILIAD